MSLKYVQTNTLYQAGSGGIIGATSIVLTSLTDIYANVLTMTDFGAKGYGTCEPDTTNEESFTFTGITANANGTYTLTGVSTALAKSPYTETSGTVRAHAGGTKVVISDTTAFWNTFGQTKNTNTWDSVQTFSALPTIPVTPSASTDAASKGYVDGVTVAGAPNASTTVKGIAQEATQAQVLAKTATGSTGADLYVNPATLSDTLLSDYKVDTGSANTYAIAPSPVITAYTVGQIFSFKAVNANTTSSTLNVNGLGTKAIVNSKGGVLVSGDIAAGMIVTVEYDGTSMVMQNPVANAPTTTVSYSADVQIFNTPGAFSWTKPTGAKVVEVWVFGGGAGGGSGRKANSDGTDGGGGGGGGGGLTYKRFSAASLSSSVSGIVGAGGAGGAAKTTVGDGNIGIVGTDSSFGSSLLIAKGGSPGAGGVNGASAAGAGGVITNGDLTVVGGAGGAGATSAGVQGVDSINVISPRGGASGGGGLSTNNGTAGGVGGGFITYYVSVGGTTGSAGVNNGAAAGAGGAGATIDSNLLIGGAGGGGGGSTSIHTGTITGTGGIGGAGGYPGGGGGGGGGSESATGGFDSGAGGVGAKGMVVVISYL